MLSKVACYRCSGLLVPEVMVDMQWSSRILHGWRCVNCGAVGDTVQANWRRLAYAHSQEAQDSHLDDEAHAGRSAGSLTTHGREPQ